jgi:hypothetical protein
VRLDAIAARRREHAEECTACGGRGYIPKEHGRGPGPRNGGERVVTTFHPRDPRTFRGSRRLRPCRRRCRPRRWLVALGVRIRGCRQRRRGICGRGRSRGGLRRTATTTPTRSRLRPHRLVLGPLPAERLPPWPRRPT